MAGNLLSSLFPQGPINLKAPRPDLQSALGIGAPPSLVSPLEPPTPQTAAPPPVATLASLMPQAPAARPAPTRAPGSDLDRLQQGYAMQAQAADTIAAGEQARSEAQYQGKQKAFDEERQGLADDEAVRQQAVADVQARRQSLYQDLDSLMNTKVDPNRLVNDSSTLQKIIGAVSIGVGGYISGRYGGPNEAYDIIKNNIDKDIAAQVEDLNTKKAGAGLKMNLIGQLMAEGKDAAEARHMVRAALFNVSMQAADAEAQRIGQPEAVARAQAMRGKGLTDLAKDSVDLKAKQMASAEAEARRRLDEQRFGLEREQFEASKPLRAAQTESAQAEAELRKAQAAAKGGLTQTEIRERTIPTAKNADGTPFIATYGKSEAIDKFNHEEMPHLMMAIRAMDQNISLAKNFNRFTDPALRSEAAQKMESNRVFLASLAKGLFGRVNKDELDLALKSAGDPQSWLDHTKQMENFRENMRASVQDQLKPFGYEDRWEPEADRSNGASYGGVAGGMPKLPPTGGGEGVDPMFDARLRASQTRGGGEDVDPSFEARRTDYFPPRDWP